MNYDLILKYKKITCYLKYILHTIKNLIIILIIHNNQLILVKLFKELNINIKINYKETLIFLTCISIISIIRYMIQTEKEICEMEILNKLEKIISENDMMH